MHVHPQMQEKRRRREGPTRNVFLGLAADVHGLILATLHFSDFARCIRACKALHTAGKGLWPLLYQTHFGHFPPLMRSGLAAFRNRLRVEVAWREGRCSAVRTIPVDSALGPIRSLAVVRCGLEPPDDDEDEGNDGSSAAAVEGGGEELALLGLESGAILGVRLSDGSTACALHGHSSVVWSLAAATLAPAGRLVASASDDGTVCVWRLPRGQLVARAAHPASVLSVLFEPDGRRLITGCADGNIRIFDLPETLLSYSSFSETSSSPFFSCSSSASSSSSCSPLPPPASSSTVCPSSLPPVPSLFPSRTLRGHIDTVLCLAAAWERDLLFSGGDIADRTIRVWRLSTGACLASSAAAEQQQHKDSIVQLHVDERDWLEGDAKGLVLTSVDDSGQFRQWHVAAAGPVTLSQLSSPAHSAAAAAASSLFFSSSSSSVPLSLLPLSSSSSVSSSFISSPFFPSSSPSSSPKVSLRPSLHVSTTRSQPCLAADRWGLKVVAGSDSIIDLWLRPRAWVLAPQPAGAGEGGNGGSGERENGEGGERGGEGGVDGKESMAAPGGKPRRAASPPALPSPPSLGWKWQQLASFRLSLLEPLGSHYRVYSMHLSEDASALALCVRSLTLGGEGDGGEGTDVRVADKLVIARFA